MSWDFARELARWGPASRPPSGGGCYAPRTTSDVVDARHPPPDGGRLAPTLAAARAYCAHVARSHYENFTVVSALLPRRLVRHFHAVYAYCRWSDDLADETTGGQAALDLLAWWRRELLTCYGGTPTHPVTIALRETIRRFDIPPEPFLDLLSAFEQDQVVTRYDTFAQLRDYCRRSADPVGHLVLYLFGCFSPERAPLSDEVCTGLQLANFWQDVARDHAIGRVYLPAEDRERFGYADGDLEAMRFTPAFRELMRFEVERARGYFDRGAKLLPLLPLEARVDVDLFIAGGRAILRAVERQGYDVWAKRPEVEKREKVRLLLRATWRWWVG